MNEDLEQSRAPIHIYNHRRLRDMIYRNQRRMATSANYITQNYNRFFNSNLTPNEFLNSINQEMVDELARRQIEPNMESERRRLLVEIDRYRKTRAIIREVRAVLMIIRYNRLSKERRRQLNIEHLSETGLTYIEDIDRTMPVYPFYFRGLRTRIPQNTTDPVTFVSTNYERYRLFGSNRITLGGILPETLVNPVLISRRTSAEDDFYDLDDSRPTGREREESLSDTETQNQEARNKNKDKDDDDSKANDNNRNSNPTVNPTSSSGELTPSNTSSTSDSRNNEAEARLQRVINLVNGIRQYERVERLTENDVIWLRHALQTYDEFNLNDYGLVRDALGQDYQLVEGLVARLRTLIENYENQVDGSINQDPVIDEDERETTTFEELHEEIPDADAEIVRSVTELCNNIMQTRFRETSNSVGTIERLIMEYDRLRLNPATADVIRSILRINPKLGRRVENLRLRLNDYNFRSRMNEVGITDLEPTPVSGFERLREMIRNFPDPNLVLFNHDVNAFPRMAMIVELYHALRPNIRFKESPIMRLSDEGRLSRDELDKLKRIFQIYRYIYSNEEIRSVFLERNRPTLEENGKSR